MSLSTHTTLPPAGAHSPQAWGSLAVLRERLARMDPELDPASPTAQAALILLAGLRMEHNVVKVAKFTALKVELVARCARRLVDNGVWRSGETICSWRIDYGDHAAFWADVAVAEGKLCRRLDESGRPEWAPGGHWWKSFDLVRQSQPERAEQSVLYYSPPPAPVAGSVEPAPDPSDWSEEDAGDLTEEESVSQVSGEPEPVSWEPTDLEKDGVGSDRTGTELFPGAVWL